MSKQITLLINAVLLFSFFFFLGCDNTESPNKKVFSSIHDVPDSLWEKLSKKKIYFGHKSVGNNIIAGINDLIKENPKIKLNIINTYNPNDFKQPVFGHSSVGENRDPVSKINAFAKNVNNGIGDNADIAFFKFCYVDFSVNTNIDQLFNNYQETIQTLKENHPNTLFIHFTAPLVSKEVGIKAFIKKLVGRPIRSGTENLYRISYNEILRHNFMGKEPIFDLEKFESTLPNGSRSIFEINGKKILQLAPEYTYDGGHLNDVGRRFVAEQLLIFLVNNLT